MKPSGAKLKEFTLLKISSSINRQHLQSLLVDFTHEDVLKVKERNAKVKKFAFDGFDFSRYVKISNAP